MSRWLLNKYLGAACITFLGANASSDFYAKLQAISWFSAIRTNFEGQMRIESVRALKQEIHEHIIGAMLGDDLHRRRLGVRAIQLDGPILPKTFALGVARHPSKRSEYVLAVRVQHPLLWAGGEVQTIVKKAQKEVDIRFVGNIQPLMCSPYQGLCRPLTIGCSIGQLRVTAGTLGAFVQDRDAGTVQILSNNHVLANENRAKRGDPIVQPGRFDHGRTPADTVAHLSRYVSLLWGQPNFVDCAVATIGSTASFDVGLLDQRGRLAGGRTAPIDGPETVHKIGRTTGFTTGMISAVEMDNITISYDQGTALFDSQIEIQGQGDGPFAAGGDSGSLVFDENHLAIGIIFGGTLQGANNKMGFTYVNPLDLVLNQLNVDLLY